MFYAESPLQIDSTKITKFLTRVKPIKFCGYKSKKVLIENTGRTVEFKLYNDNDICNKNDKQKAYLTGGILRENTKYIFNKLYFKWSKIKHKGSEHIVDNHRYTLEVQLEHYNSKYKSFDEAAKKFDGLLYLAFFIQANYEENLNFQNIFDAIKMVYFPKKRFLSEFDFFSWIDFTSLRKCDYFTYRGSTTFPPYSRNVIWIIYPKPICISKFQMLIFHDILRCSEYNLGTIKKISNNCRKSHHCYDKTRSKPEIVLVKNSHFYDDKRKSIKSKVKQNLLEISKLLNVRCR